MQNGNVSVTITSKSRLCHCWGLSAAQRDETTSLETHIVFLTNRRMSYVFKSCSAFGIQKLRASARAGYDDLSRNSKQKRKKKRLLDFALELKLWNYGNMWNMFCRPASALCGMWMNILCFYKCVSLSTSRAASVLLCRRPDFHQHPRGDRAPRYNIVWRVLPMQNIWSAVLCPRCWFYRVPRWGTEQ